MTGPMDNRIAWRFLDFWKDVIMHHRKFTPFQKLVFLTFLMGVILGVFRSFWSVGIAVTYGVSIYFSVTLSQVILARNNYLGSDVVLAFYNRVVQTVANFLHQQDIKIQRDNSMSEGVNAACSVNSGDQVQDDEFYDAPDKMTTYNRKDSLTPKEMPTYHDTECDQVSEEIKIILHFIHRDFVQSWYNLFSSDEEGLMEAEALLSNVCHDLKLRLGKLDRFEVAQIVMLMFSNHINKVRQAQMMLKAQRRRRRSSVKPTSSESTASGQTKPATVIYKTVEECFGAKSELHPAVRNKELEQMYQKSVVEIILLNVFEDNLTETKTVICALKEILMCNILQSLLSLISDSSFLHERIIKITSDEELFECKESEPAVIVTENDTDTADKVAKSNLASGAGSPDGSTSICNNVCKEHLGQTRKVFTEVPNDQRSTEHPDCTPPPEDDKAKEETHWVEGVKTYTVSKAMCNECNRLCSKDRDRISPRTHTCSLGTTPVFFDADRQSIDSFESFGSMSTVSREGSPVFEVEKRDSYPFTPTLDNIPDIKVDDDMHDNVFHDADSPSGAKANKDQIGDAVTQSAKEDKDQTVLSKEQTNIQDLGNIEVANEPAEVENGNKNMSDMLLSLIPNPLNAFPILRKKSSSGLNVRNRSSPSLEQVDEKSDSFEIRKSISSEDILRDPLTPTSPFDDIPWPLDGPKCVFQDIRLTGTETAKEPNGTSVYTLYIVEYEALYQTEEDLVHRTGSVKRRFREFVNLQSRLEDNSQYKESLRDIKGPKKLIPSLPFGNMGKETLESRKKLLETFIVQLIKRTDICNGDELKQFLGYSGDGHIAFVRKNPESTARIDQRLVKTMSGVFDKIVEGLPSLPPQLPRIMTSSSSRDDREDETKPLVDLDQFELDFSVEKDQSLHQRVDSALDKFMSKKLFELVVEEEEETGDVTLDLGVSVLGWQEKLSTGGSVTPVPKLTISSPKSPPLTSPKVKPGHDIGPLDNGECPLISALLNILSELLAGHHSWFCRENVTHTTKVCLGKALDRYLETKVEYLTSEHMNTFYLHTLKDTLWPEGQLSVEPRPVYTDGQKEILKKQASRCLGDFLPDVLKTLLGSEDFDHLIEEVFETIQYEKLNRHFWYSVVDILLEKLFPEVNSKELQRKLSVTPEH